MNRKHILISLLALMTLFGRPEFAAVADPAPTNATSGGSHQLPVGTTTDLVNPAHGPGEGDEEAGEDLPAPNTYSNDYLFNIGNGVVQTSPRVYIVFWGDWTTKGDPYNTQNRLYYFYNGLGGTSYGNVLTQYQQGCTAGTWNCTGAHAGNPANPYRGYWKDNLSFVPTTPTQAQVAAEAQRAAAHFNDFSYNAQYVIALPTGHGDTRFASKGGNACGWHAWVAAGNTWISYTSLPYQPDAPICYTNAVNRTNGTLDGVTMVAGHEYAESVTDPGLNAWNDRYGAENGDKCSSYSGNVTLSNGYTFPMQTTWSNYHKYYYGSGCRLAW